MLCNSILRTDLRGAFRALRRPSRTFASLADLRVYPKGNIELLRETYHFVPSTTKNNLFFTAILTVPWVTPSISTVLCVSLWNSLRSLPSASLDKIL